MEGIGAWEINETKIFYAERKNYVGGYRPKDNDEDL
jgi:hypothetical protein